MARRVSPSVSHHEALTRRLKNSKYAAKYLTACLEDGDESFLLALREVAEAHGGIRKLAARTHLNREHLFRMLSNSGNPEFHSMREIVGGLGLKLALQPA